MIRPVYFLWACAVSLAVLMFGPHLSGEHSANGVVLPGENASLRYRDFNSGFFMPLVPLDNLDGRKVALGRELFMDVRLSGDNTVSCNSCHNLYDNGADRQPRSVGVLGREGELNAPTVFNSAFNISQFWDGRAETLEEQVRGPIENPVEMDSSWQQVIGKLSQDKEFVGRFNQVYPDGINQVNLADAIASFERSLVTPAAPFDRYLQGDTMALSKQAKQGLKKFKGLGCVSCHQGINLGGNMYQRFGVFREVDEKIATDSRWVGRFAVTGNEQDRYVFKVPGLRNVATTAPYFHDGQTATLEDAVQLMGQYQLGRDLSPEDVSDIVSFLESLTGERPSLDQEDQASGLSHAG